MKTLRRPRTLDQSTLWAMDPRHYCPPELPPSIGADLSGRLRLRAAAAAAGKAASSAPEVDPTIRVGDIAVINIAGALRKSPTIWRSLGCSEEATTPEIEAAIRKAAKDSRVSATLLRISSPGGEVFGTPQVADAVFEHRAVKPIIAYIEDLGASAAYWIASQATEVVGHRIAHVGSIGVFAVLVDSSEAAVASGLKFHLVASAPLKGSGVMGVPLAEDYLEAVQGEIETNAALFLADIGRGRGLSQAQTTVLHDGRTYIGQQALDRGLIDRVENLDETIARLQGSARSGDVQRTARHEALAKFVGQELSSESQGTTSTACAQSSAEEGGAT